MKTIKKILIRVQTDNDRDWYVIKNNKIYHPQPDCMSNKEAHIYADGLRYQKLKRRKTNVSTI